MTENIPRIPAWVTPFRTLLRDQSIPKFGNDELSILTDYSGTSGRHCYKVYSFLIFSRSQSPDWPQLRHDLRKRFPDRRRISYKALSPSSHLQSQLEPFLSIAETLAAWCVTVAVHESFKKLVTEDKSCLAVWQQIAKLEGSWKPPQFENVLRIVHFLSLLLAEIIGNSVRIEWISDQDDIFANDAKCSDVTSVLRLCLGSYVPNAMGRILVGTSEIDTGHRGIEDLLAIPDLAAGAVADFTNARDKKDDLPDKAITIAKWLRHSSGPLSKCSIEFRPDLNGQMSLARLESQLMSVGS